jgi:hemerythrin
MASFQWSKYFETGLASVDQQHRVLVDLINRLGALPLGDGNDQTDAERLFEELAAYAKYHFAEEEEFMSQVQLDTRHISAHKIGHDEFMHKIAQMHQRIADHHEDVQGLLRFLIHWLAFHILGTDQFMAKQISAVRAGKTPEEAYLTEQAIRTHAVEPLLAALDGLFNQISERNRELIDLNRTLETKVDERTRSLSTANKVLEQMALTDILTGLPNRRSAMTWLDQQWSESTRHGSALACMMIDADGFKKINDQFGHDAGDEVLRQLAKQIRYALRTDDVVCRLGGDEFLVLCPGTPLDGALHAAETVRREIAMLHVSVGDGGEWLGSISVGVAVRTEAMHGTEDLIKAADDAVYLAKRNGRNRVEYHDTTVRGAS